MADFTQREIQAGLLGRLNPRFGSLPQYSRADCGNNQISSLIQLPARTESQARNLQGYAMFVQGRFSTVHACYYTRSPRNRFLGKKSFPWSQMFIGKRRCINVSSSALGGEGCRGQRASQMCRSAASEVKERSGCRGLPWRGTTSSRHVLMGQNSILYGIGVC